ncbi:MAG: helix-turn-helix transcriptional regulator [Ruminococcaceae bacterium]|nr:helix-turn-helix transcriptional regulator [Oscillospiraceae bacterium]
MKLNKQATETAMAECGFNKIDLANKMGVSRQMVYKYLDGSPCRPKTAKRFADALGVPVRDIVESDLEPAG